MKNGKPQLKDYKYLNDLDASKENPKEKIRLIVLVCCWTIFPWVIALILHFSDFFDSQLFGNIMIIVFGFPVVAWGVHRTWTRIINPK